MRFQPLSAEQCVICWVDKAMNGTCVCACAMSKGLAMEPCLCAQDVRAYQQRTSSSISSGGNSLAAPDTLHNIFQEVPAYQQRPFVCAPQAPQASGSCTQPLSLHFAVGLSVVVQVQERDGWPVTVPDLLAGAAAARPHGSAKIVTDGAMAEDAHVRSFVLDLNKPGCCAWFPGRCSTLRSIICAV